ncbi:protein-export chaperone SecB [Gilvimarinus sp. SDUM040013]|uniref:Protein-export protein SecB n=1 Tax=Gilvimarinus gilvus TaxID=3058038 RepID=A0ABU4RUM4_9GAMM|nr:protein-export chaperone SecB [Gilvimarinus sp. SDUM040013]MDO3388548.1 protein-export chaperone SecB [Gilvimarinus sp. SDUM040013]MDX6848580.1 protein-export chaperone SecB [Gilvimarinus sp. SDUM040013]
MSEENTPAEENTQAAGNEGAEPSFAIKRIYLKDLSFETPMGLEGYSQTKAPKVNQELNVQVNKVNDTHHEVVLFLTITATVDERAVFLVEVKQAGVFEIANMPNQAIAQIINANCPNILFPYAREAIDSILNRGGFSPINLPPINFDAVFAQAVSEAQQRQQTGATADA